ncbi:alpha-mannosidase [Paenibacillus marchantiophytorum]|uniref:Alpha-mannosidase n=1 Tax=Paenibacillus marchantiophytorum TaxID=1619310 RepID=A0ABQ1EVS8_9BACL|nr:alpha-mannosidase [Paenibacillus marchantiophytorum]GFZ88594.1 alpha-mannosidase [Paenibacillus marchantiophytorum]
MLWTYEKIAKRVEELQPYRYRDAVQLNEFRFALDADGHIGEYPSEQGEWGTIRLGDTWRGYDQYAWLAASVQIPAHWSGKKVLGLFDFGTTGGGHNSGFESLLFVNGQPFQGVDSNHQEVFLPEALAGEELDLSFRLWSGLGGYQQKPDPLEHWLHTAQLCWLDEETDDLYFTAKAVIDTIRLLSEHQPEKHSLLSIVDRAFLQLDWSRPGSSTFYSSICAARAIMREGLEKQQKTSPVVIQCIGHTHIDVAWLWRLAHTREKAARSFSTVLRLMEQFPDYVFLQTQPQLYAYIKEDYPDIYAQMKERIAEGRWEAGGAMWLEADCNLSSGESLVRQILYGTRFLKEEFGVECTYLWLPDVFGYSWALPQILKKSGITMFMTTKISWNQYNRMPHDTFRWRGIDGSEVLTHFITTPDPGGGEGAFYYTYNGAITPYSVNGIWEGYRDKNLNHNLLLAYGYGDGGGGVNREMLEMRRRLDELPGLPQVTTGRADAFFAELEKTVEASDAYVHTWDGELYLELHRGTYTSQAYNKRMNRKLELLYRETEWLQAMTALQAGSPIAEQQPIERLQAGWKIILRNQFHDIIPGSSIRQVYEDSWVEYHEAEQIARDVRALSWANNGEDSCITVLNSSPWTRTDLVEISAASDKDVWATSTGDRCDAQRTENGWLVLTPELPAMGYLTLTAAEAWSGASQDEVFQPIMNGLETPFYVLNWDDNGSLTRLYDKQAQREVLASGERGNELQVFEDKPKGRHEAWDIDIFYTEKKRVVEDCRSIELIESGPLRATIAFTWGYGDSTIEQQMRLYAHSRRIDFETRIDWHEQRQLLKVAFPVVVRSTEATYDIQFGNVKRPTHWNTSWDYARFETVGHQWADLSERDYGVSLLNDCKYGYDIKDYVMRLTLIKSAMVPDPIADQGEHVFTYSLLPHLGDWYAGGTVQEAWALNNPLTSMVGRSSQESFSLLRLSLPNVMVDAVKWAEDGHGLIVRVHEYAGARGTLSVETGFPVSSWQETDLREQPIGDVMTGTITCEIMPYEIKTWLID